MTVAIDPMAELAICLLMKQAVPKGDVLGAGRARQEEERAGGNEKLMSHALFPMCVGRDRRGSALVETREGANRAGSLHSSMLPPYRAKTNNMVWLRISRSSGVCECRRLEIGLSPDRIAIYCLPLTSNVIGGALKPVPTLIFQSGSKVMSS